METIDVIIVDDHPIFTDSLRSALEAQAGFNVTATAYNGEDALKVLERYPCHVLVLDICLPGMDGIETAQLVQENFPLVKILVLTGDDSPDNIALFRKLKVKGYLLKGCSMTELQKAIETMAKGDEYYSPLVTDIFFKYHPRKKDEVKFTPREKDVFEVIMEKGWPRKLVANELNMAHKTVHNYYKNLFIKTQTQSVSELIIWGFRNGYGVL